MGGRRLARPVPTMALWVSKFPVPDFHEISTRSCYPRSSDAGLAADEYLEGVLWNFLDFSRRLTPVLTFVFHSPCSDWSWWPSDSFPYASNASARWGVLEAGSWPNGSSWCRAWFPAPALSTKQPSPIVILPFAFASGLHVADLAFAHVHCLAVRYSVFASPCPATSALIPWTPRVKSVRNRELIWPASPRQSFLRLFKFLPSIQPVWGHAGRALWIWSAWHVPWSGCCVHYPTRSRRSQSCRRSCVGPLHGYTQFVVGSLLSIAKYRVWPRRGIDDELLAVRVWSRKRKKQWRTTSTSTSSVPAHDGGTVPTYFPSFDLTPVFSGRSFPSTLSFDVLSTVRHASGTPRSTVFAVWLPIFDASVLSCSASFPSSVSFSTLAWSAFHGSSTQPQYGHGHLVVRSPGRRSAPAVHRSGWIPVRLSRAFHYGSTSRCCGRRSRFTGALRSTSTARFSSSRALQAN